MRRVRSYRREIHAAFVPPARKVQGQSFVHAGIVSSRPSKVARPTISQGVGTSQAGTVPYGLFEHTTVPLLSQVPSTRHRSSPVCFDSTPKGRPASYHRTHSPAPPI